MVKETAASPETGDRTDAMGGRLEPSLPRVAAVQQLDQLIVVTRGRAWLALAALGVLLAGLVVWAVLARVPVTERASAVRLPGGAIAQITTPTAGRVEALDLEVGGDVDAGDVVAVITRTDGTRSRVTAAQSGTVLAVVAATGDIVASAAPLAKLESDDQPRLHAFLAFDLGQQVDVGDASTVTLSRAGGGSDVIDATVAQVTRVPLDRADVAGLVGDAALAKLLVGEGRTVAAVELRARRPQDLSNAASGTALIGDAQLVLGEQHPIAYIAR